MKLPSSKYKGVVAQQSGKWGAQIYNNNERIWLGTFRTEFKAARTYDLAAKYFHRTHAVTNFNAFSKSDEDTKAELEFLMSRTTTEILSMLRRHTYHVEMKRSQQMHQIQHMQCNNACKVTSNEKETQELLFFKVISSGDIGPQNRLLIPRKHAQKYFPVSGSSSGAGKKRSVMINFEDRTGKIWRFRYTYWRSSNNHVLNGGWAEFAREKHLKPGDVVQFWRVTNKLGDIQLFIECDTMRSAMVPSPALELPRPQYNQIIRLFGINVSVSVLNN